ncbi:ribonuclease H-like domain-containing protein, partial [Tanacetum coccineum]
MHEIRQMTIPFLSRLNGYYCEEKKGSYGPQLSKAYFEALHINNSIPRKEKDLGSFTLPCFINNACLNNALVDLGARVSVMPLSTYLNLGLGELAHTRLTVELTDRTMKYPKGIAENVLVRIEETIKKNPLLTMKRWLLWLFQTLRTEFNKSQSNLANYKRGLASVEEQLVFYRKNEVIFGDKINVLKRDVSFKDSNISWLKSELEKAKLKKESYQLKIENFENASKSLDQLLWSQIIDKSRKGVGFVSYNAVPPPHTGLFSPPKIDLSNSGLEEFQEPEFEGYGPKTSKSASEDISNEVRKSNDPPLVEK